VTKYRRIRKADYLTWFEETKNQHKNLAVTTDAKRSRGRPYFKLKNIITPSTRNNVHYID